MTAGISYHRAFLFGLWRFSSVPAVRQPVLMLWAGKDVYARESMCQVPASLASDVTIELLPEVSEGGCWAGLVGVVGGEALEDGYNSTRLLFRDAVPESWVSRGAPLHAPPWRCWCQRRQASK